MYKLSWQIATVPVDVAVQNEIERRLGHALDRFEGNIEQVHVRLEDLNGPRGGCDKQVRIDLTVRGARDLSIRQRAEDWHIAARLAAGRMGRTLERELSRRKDRQTRGRSIARKSGRTRFDRARREAELFETTHAAA